MTEHRLAPTYRLISSHLPTYGSGFQGMQVITACSCGETRPVEGYGGWWAWHLADALDAAAAPAIGAVPGTPAAEPKADQRWRDRQGDVWLETSDVGRLLRLVEFEDRTHLDGSVQEFADVEATWGPLVLIPQRDDDAEKACSCAPLLTSAGPRRLTAPECPEHGEGAA